MLRLVTIFVALLAVPAWAQKDLPEGTGKQTTVRVCTSLSRRRDVLRGPSWEGGVGRQNSQYDNRARKRHYGRGLCDGSQVSVYVPEFRAKARTQIAAA